jgi:hypothetical protein
MHHQQGLHTNQHFPAQTFYEKGDQKPLCTWWLQYKNAQK